MREAFAPYVIGKYGKKNMRINFFGGPGAGKSTSASWLFSELKKRNKSVEYVSEYVKFWAYSQRKIHQYDQIYLFGKQMQSEYKYLVHGVKNTVTDSPILLAAVYAEINGACGIAEHLASICEMYDADYPSLNIYLKRGDKGYDESGRYQTTAQALEADALILEYLEKYYTRDQILKVDYNDQNTILERVLEVIE